MAKSTSRKKKSDDQVTDRTLWFSDITSLDPAKKNEVWAAQALFFMKRMGGTKLFLDTKKAETYRKTDRLEINKAEYKQIVDPKTPMGSGGTAEYFASDWSANPIYLHLKNIVKADIEKTGKQIEINLTDKYAKTRQMNDNYKILYQKKFRELINYFSEELGIPGITDMQDPYKWADNLMKKGDDVTQSPDMTSKFLDLIKNQITDDQDMALYNELIYKGDYEMAFELGLEYYIFNLNKWNERWADEFINDIMHFNKAAGEWYTDLVTGRPVVERFVPEALFTSPFRRKDGEDIQYYFTEYSISFGDFIRSMGKNLTEDKLKQVFLLMKQQGYHSVDWRDEFYNFSNANFIRDSAMVRIGKAAMLSTDMEVQMEDTSTGSAFRQQVELTWKPLNDNQERIEKRYNVWRWWNYIPPILADLNNANWEWQSQFIFNLQKFQDQQRYGDNGRYAKSPLVIYDNSSQATFTDIVQSFMPKITHLWQRYQNYLVNDIDATILSDEFIGGLLGAIDEDNKINAGDPNIPTGGNGKDAYMEQWRMIKQNGVGFLRMNDKNGQPMLDPSKMMLTIKNEYLKKAEGCLSQMFMLYDLMIKSLAFSPATAGEEVKPRTPVAALEQTIKATDSSRFFIQKGYEDFIKMYGERFVRYIIDIANEVDKYEFPDRWEEFMENVGYANGLAIEGMKDIDPECVGMTVSYVDNQAKKDFIMQLALEYVKTKELNDEFIYLLMGVDNWKYAFVLMRLALKHGRKLLAEEAAKQQQYQMQLKQADLQIAQALIEAKTAGTDQNIVTKGKIQEMINTSLNDAKQRSQSQLKSETDLLRERENKQKADLQKDMETHKKGLEMQQPITV